MIHADNNKRMRTHMSPHHLSLRMLPVLLPALLLAFATCTKQSGPLAPYASSDRPLSGLAVQESVYTPAVRWIGGYVTVLGVNVGSRAALDTTLVELIYAPANSLKYPVTIGTLPAGAQNIAAQYGGQNVSRLTEDNVYTFWVMKDEAWSAASSLRNRPIIADTTAAAPLVNRNDTLVASAMEFVSVTSRLDVYINIKDVLVYGRLMDDITVTQSDSSNMPVVTFTIAQGIADSGVSAVGICSGEQYNVNSRAWEVISADVRSDTTIYWKNDVVRSPLRMGQSFPGTATFVVYPAEGLKRNQQYYLWFANKNWDQTTRLRSTPNYGFATFYVW